MMNDTMKQFLRLFFGAGLLLTEPRQRQRVYDRVTDKFDDVADQASRGYDAAADRVERMYRAARGENHSGLVSVASFVAGIGVGVGAGLLFAPGSGKDTRAAIAGKFEDIQSDVRDSFRQTDAGRKTA